MIYEDEFHSEVENFVEEEYTGQFSVSINLEDESAIISVNFDSNSDDMIPLNGYMEIITDYLDSSNLEGSGKLDTEEGNYVVTVQSR